MLDPGDLRRTGGFIAVALVFLVDQLTKAWAVESLIPGLPRQIVPGFDLSLGFNSGVMSGLFVFDGVGGRWLVVAVTGAVTLALLIWLLREYRAGYRYPLALVVGGALGNLSDRLRTGAVAEFLDAHVGALDWPAFNLADAAIAIGAALLFWRCLRPERRTA